MNKCTEARPGTAFACRNVAATGRRRHGNTAGRRRDDNTARRRRDDNTARRRRDGNTAERRRDGNTAERRRDGNPAERRRGGEAPPVSERNDGRRRRSPAGAGRIEEAAEWRRS